MLMSNFWSMWISILTILVIVGCFVLLRICTKNTTPDIKEGESMGHSFDGIEELNNPLPKWWSYMFYITIVFGVIYLAAYPGLGNYKGFLGWSSSNQSIGTEQGIKTDSAAAIESAKADGRYVQYDEEVKVGNLKTGPMFQKYAAIPVEELAKDPEAVKVGGRLFLQNCAQCHGSDARGSNGFPNLTDTDWLYGGSGDEIKTTLLNGRNGMMPPKGGLPIDDSEIPGLVAYIHKLGGNEHDAALAAQGQASFMKGCFACHGMDAKGNKLMGAPNLTDDVWLYGGSDGKITQSIQYGLSGVMPAWKGILGEEKVHVIAAYVYSLSNK